MSPTDNILLTALRDLIERGEIDPDDLLNAVHRATAEAVGIEIETGDEEEGDES